MPNAPMFLATNFKALLAQIRNRPEAGAILRSIPGEVIEAIERSTSLSWMPAAYNVLFAKALASSLPPPARQKLFRDLGNQVVENPLAKSILTFAVKMSGVSPKALLKLVPPSFKMQLRDAGTWENVPVSDPNVGELKWTNVPQEMVDYPLVFEAYVSGHYVIFDLCRVSGTIESKLDAPKRELTLHFVWK